MTTLPQTTPARLPRPSATSALAIPGLATAGGSAGFAPPAGIQMTGADMWRVIRSNMWLILLVLVVSAILGFVVNFWLKQNYSRYTAIGTLEQVVPTADDGSNR